MSINTSARLMSATTQRRLACATVAGIILYVVLDVVAQLLPPHYNPISQAESDLAVGPYGFVMTINFVLRGLLSLACVAALAGSVSSGKRALPGLTLLGIWGVSALLLAAFPTDLADAPPTLHGTLHLVFAAFAFIGAALGETLLALRLAGDDRWRTRQPVLLAIASAADAVLLLDFLAARFITRHDLFGLVERLFLGLILLWLLVAALHVWQQAQSGPTPRATTREARATTRVRPYIPSAERAGEHDQGSI